jgi:hypothetical protein
MLDPGQTEVVEGRLAFGNRREAGNGGCTPGFWKNNAEKKDAVAWPDPDSSVAGALEIGPDDPLSDAGFSGFTVLAGDATTFLDALGNGGGGENALMRHAAAAYLNAVSGFYPLSPAQVVSQVNTALASGDATTIENTKNQLDSLNNLGCGFDQQGRRINATSAQARTARPAIAARLGDVNLDGTFDSSDLVLLFQGRQYEDGIEKNSTWYEGDFNGDQEFDSRDLVYLFQETRNQKERSLTHGTRDGVNSIDLIFALLGAEDSRKSQVI